MSSHAELVRRLMARLGPVAGLALLVWLAWGLAARLDFWQTRSFVLLLAAAGMAAVASTVSAWPLRNPPGRVTRYLRRLVWTAVLFGVVWCLWPKSRSLVAYCVRAVSMARFR